MTDNHAVCTQFGIHYEESLLKYPLIQEREQIIPYTVAKLWPVLPIAREGEILIIALTDPLNIEAIEEVRCLTGKNTKEVCVSKETMEEAIALCYGQKEEATTQLIATIKAQEEILSCTSEGYDLLEYSSDSNVIQLLNALFTEAIQQGASDIHFEPMEQGLEVRYRIDGVLQMRHSPPKEVQSQLITRIKVIARLDIAETRLPQDGRIKLKIGERQIDFRVSTIPVVYGERVVLRILDKGNVILGLSKIGMSSPCLNYFKKMISAHEGIVLVTGPTGSGKTTTLYSAIAEIKSPEINIMTIEDPVEYKLQGLAQVGVNPKINLSFAAGLRHILRQDPDVIMIGEIRDQETAEIAIQSSLTGHLVLSTLHTNDAPSALTRLVDMGIEPYLLSSSIVGVLAQRLVRMICPHCKLSYLPQEAELHDLKIEPGPYFYIGQGCESCFFSGYKGRHGIYELMEMTPSIKRQLFKSADAVEIRTLALQEGMHSLRQEGIALMLQGITTVKEVLRVT